MEKDFNKLRREMAENQLKTRSIKSEAVLNAMCSVPRHLFVSKDLQNHAYDDSPLSIGLGQTISQPYIVAYMTELLGSDPDSFRQNNSGPGFLSGLKILEIGTGSGYQAAILAHLGAAVYTVELLEILAERAKKILSELSYSNVTVKKANGYSGWPEEAPFDAIIITAAPENIPGKLIEQLKDGGKMIVPVGPVHAVQSLKLIIKRDNRIIDRDLIPVRFVPMVK